MNWFRKKFGIQPLNFATAVVLALFILATPALALPTIKSQWHYLCATKPVSKKTVLKAKSQANRRGLRGAIGTFNYACQLEQYEFLRYQAAVKRHEEKGGPKAPQLNNRGSAAQLNRAGAKLKAQNRRKNSNAKAQYYYGFALALAGNELAVNVLDTLMRQHQGSKEHYLGALALGDYYFERQEHASAIREYKTAKKSKSPAVKFYAEYKINWTNFFIATAKKNAGGQKRAIRSFVQLFKKSGKSGKPGQRLAGLIKADLIDILAETGNLKYSRQVLSQVGASEVYAGLLERLAAVRVSNGDVKGAGQFYSLMLKERPLDKDNLRISSYVIEIAAQSANVPLLAKHLRFATLTYANKKSRWAKKQNKRT